MILPIYYAGSRRTDVWPYRLYATAMRRTISLGR